MRPNLPGFSRRRRAMHDRSKGNKGVLVEEALAGNCAAETRDTIVAADLALKLVIVSEFLVCFMLVYAFIRCGYVV